MNIIEYDLFIFALVTLLIYFYVVHTEYDYKFSILSVIIISPILYLSICQSTSFLTVDETSIILESIDMKNSNMSWWNNMVIWRMGCLRTTDLIIGSIFSILNQFVELSKYGHLSKIIAKAIHWYIGLLLILYVHYLLDKNYLNPKNSKINSILTISLFLLLPVTNFSLRIFNYDLFSMLFATIAFICLLNAINKSSKKEAFLSIIFALFAAQEKLNVSPILTISVFLFTYYTYK
ncbi:MAG: hypothetical protein JRJ27_12655, partial [Deltaproteobacteria bacterium]|nr:hypothetical protein [Deltaproteobacteria bacterium]